MGIFSVFKRGLKKTRDEGITAQLDEVVDSYEKITPEFFDNLEEILIMGDVGMPTAERIIRDLKSKIENDKVDDVRQVREMMKHQNQRDRRQRPSLQHVPDLACRSILSK